MKYVKAVCTICGYVANNIEQMNNHYKKHPEVKCIDGVNECEIHERMLQVLKQEGNWKKEEEVIEERTPLFVKASIFILSFMLLLMILKLIKVVMDTYL